MSDIYIKDEDTGTIRKITYEQALIEFIEKRTPPAVTSKQIADAMGVPYSTIHHRLVKLATNGKIKQREDRSMKVGRRPMLWEKV